MTGRVSAQLQNLAVEREVNREASVDPVKGEGTRIWMNTIGSRRENRNAKVLGWMVETCTLDINDKRRYGRMTKIIRHTCRSGMGT